MSMGTIFYGMGEKISRLTHWK